jgi:hypothetical protein
MTAKMISDKTLQTPEGDRNEGGRDPSGAYGASSPIRGAFPPKYLLREK